jgi:hypothetical protein
VSNAVQDGAAISGGRTLGVCEHRDVQVADLTMRVDEIRHIGSAVHALS